MAIALRKDPMVDWYKYTAEACELVDTTQDTALTEAILIFCDTLLKNHGKPAILSALKDLYAELKKANQEHFVKAVN